MLQEKETIMRLGEIKNILSAVLNDKQNIKIVVEPKYGNQVYLIKNYNALMKALKVLNDQPWNTSDFNPIEQLFAKYGDAEQSVALEAQDYNRISQYINAINPKIPYFFGILSSMVPKQDEQIINIKLPNNSIKDFKSLSAENDDLNKLLQSINLDGDYEFKRFDIGSSWYTVLILGYLTYKALLAAINLAQKYYGAKEAYYKSETARIAYEAANNKKATEAELEKFAKKYIDLTIETEIQNISIAIGIEKDNEDARNRIRKTVDLLIAQMEKGAEFHLSLNPPKYAEESEGKISLNYEEIRQINEREVPQIENQSEEN